MKIEPTAIVDESINVVRDKEVKNILKSIQLKEWGLGVIFRVQCLTY